MRTKKENVLARSPLLRGAFCATLLAFVACGGDNSSNTNSTEMGCASNQAKPTENYTSSTLMSQILESLKGEPKVDPLGLFKEDTRTVQQKIEKYGIEVASQTKSSMIFRLSGAEYSFKVQGTEDTLKVSLSSGSIACGLSFPMSFVDQCPQESTDTPASLKNSQAEFEDCIKKIAPASKEDSGNKQPGYDGEFN